jgi:hypothetical protein
MIKALATALAVNRVAFGVGYLVAPRQVWRGGIGKAADERATTVFTRALGARDLALGLGALAALFGGRPDARAWFAAHALSDSVDFVATVAARRELPASGTAFALSVAGASTAVAVAGAAALDE